jgi:NAD(P)H-dependent FMN reductase
MSVPFKVFAVSGSLRAGSLNSMLLRAASRLAPPGVEVHVYSDLATIPPFNADVDSQALPCSVDALRSLIVSSDAVLIASPEYARGVSGVMKNALDWMVGNESFVDKPVGILNASPRALTAQAALQETLATMSARIVPAACVTVGILGSGFDEIGIIRHAEMSAAIFRALLALQAQPRALSTSEANGGPRTPTLR